MDFLHQKLLDPAAYPDSTTRVSFRETHISRVYLTDTRAYKLKKPLDLGFLDFSTLAKRRHYCQEEVRLNRRFNSDTYLGVCGLYNNCGEIRFNGSGQLIDYAVCMRRLPETSMLKQMIFSQTEGLRERMPELAQSLHELFSRAEVCRNEDASNPQVIINNCIENFEQTKLAIGEELTSEAHQLMQSHTNHNVQALKGLFVQREQAGFVRDGHGDLHTANICMSTPIRIYDCIEFNRRFRVNDVASELAFLLMDLEFLNRRDLSKSLLQYYQDQQDNDPGLAQLLPFYKAYRAWVRGKVEAILSREHDVDDKQRRDAANMACRYFNLALGYALAPTLFVVSGLMGTGKTTFASALAKATGAKHYRSDVIRKQMGGIPEFTAVHSQYGKGLYSEDMTRWTYAKLIEMTIKSLPRQSVIVDASFAKASDRQMFLQLALEKRVPSWFLFLQCPDDLAKNRLKVRQHDASDGRAELFSKQKGHFDPIIPSENLIHVDTTKDVDQNVQQVLCQALMGQGGSR
ncbi:MAG: AAA family ATPase [Deltaproteobacteria bacterium]|jgi:aminoglycoside phosphotransferase family enzyme/gluconate kinase|nr:AAA family ATPase [Deltaproteobacteria bacterium]